jgi:cell division protein FtsN
VATTTPPAPTAPRFEFYDVLPANGKPVAKSAQAAQIPPAPNNTTTPPRPPAPAPVIGNYALQVASFRDSNSAEALKAHLSGLGIAAFVLPVTLNNGETWYRVRAGAFQDANQATQARGQLLSHGLAADVVRNQ